MYHLDDFSNTILQLRREKGWTQAEFAEKLRISPQSISKWECGIGFPDVTLFPAIAEILAVPIGVLFGKIETEERKRMEKNQNSQNPQNSLDNQYDQNRTERYEEFGACGTIRVRCGNVGRIEVINGTSGRGHIHVVGDPLFLRCFVMEHISGHPEPDELVIDIKNPTGSALRWNSYDRQGYEGENFVQIYTGVADADVDVHNYLDLNCVSGTNMQGNFEVVCYAEDAEGRQ